MGRTRREHLEIEDTHARGPVRGGSGRRVRRGRLRRRRRAGEPSGTTTAAASNFKAALVSDVAGFNDNGFNKNQLSA